MRGIRRLSESVRRFFQSAGPAEMSEPVTDEKTESLEDAKTNSPEDTNVVARRVLLIAKDGAGAVDGAKVDDGTSVEALREKIASAGFEVARASVESAARRVEEFAPDVVLIAFGGREGEGRLVTLARRLRSEPATFALPVVLLFRADERTLRSAAQHVGADDYFARDATPEEFRARVNALLWRVEAGRRTSPAVADQRSEIDNFLFLLDAVGADERRGMSGALALVETRSVVGVAREVEGEREGRVEREGERGGKYEGGRERSLVAAHGFLKLNLRRVDAVAFYGPSTLLVYLPGADSSAARVTLARLREEFLEAGPKGELLVGISSFPAHGTEIERLVEQAEVALDEARDENSRARVVVYSLEGTQPDSASASARGAADAGRRKTTAVVNEASTYRAAPFGAEGVASASASSAESRGVDGARAAQASYVASRAGERRVGARPRRLMLVVSDAARMAQVNLLLRSEGFEVRAAFDGQHALNLLRIDNPDVLVIDYELQGMDGVEMLRRLAKQSGTTQVPPALLLVPSAREELRGEALKAGARAVVRLPYDPLELLDTLRGFGETE